MCRDEVRKKLLDIGCLIINDLSICLLRRVPGIFIQVDFNGGRYSNYYQFTRLYKLDEIELALDKFMELRKR